MEYFHSFDLIQRKIEIITPLPERGEGRNHDVACTCMIGKWLATVCIEGKTDESFGEQTVLSLIFITISTEELLFLLKLFMGIYL
jgi:hypothetical protein